MAITKPRRLFLYAEMSARLRAERSSRAGKTAANLLWRALAESIGLTNLIPSMLRRRQVNRT